MYFSAMKVKEWSFLKNKLTFAIVIIIIIIIITIIIVIITTFISQ